MIQDGDSRFIGLDMRRDPAVVAEGYYTRGEHVECVDGTVRTRRGNLVVPWGDAYQYTSIFDLRPVEKHGTIIDAIRFADTMNNRDYCMLANSEAAYLCLPGATAQKIDYPASYVPEADARLIQAYDKVFLLGGESTRPLYWDGDIANDFVFADTGAVSGGKVAFPSTRLGCYHKNRLWVVGDDPNQVYPSDILEYVDFYAGNEFYVNQGDSDRIRALVPYTENRIIAFKNNSIYSLDNLTGTLTDAEINLVSNNFGIVADRSAQVVGPSIIWLDRRGVMSAVLEYDQRLTPDMVPLSEPIEPIMDRINWAYAEKAVSAVHGERYYLAIPLDDNTSNSAVLVYNFKNQAWESVDVYDGATFTAQATDYTEHFGPQTMTILKFVGKTILLTTTYAGCLALYRYNWGKQDRAIEGTDDMTTWLATYATGSTQSDSKFVQQEMAFSSIVETRGYACGTMETKRGFHIDLNMEKFDSKCSLSLLATGHGEEETIYTDITQNRRSRLDWQGFGYTYIPNNANNEHGEPYRREYAIYLDSAITGQTGARAIYVWFYFGDEAKDLTGTLSGITAVGGDPGALSHSGSLDDLYYDIVEIVDGGTTSLSAGEQYRTNGSALFELNLADESSSQVAWTGIDSITVKHIQLDIEDANISKLQDFAERYRIYKRDRSPRLRITNKQGCVTLNSVTIKGYERNRHHRREV